MAEKVFDFQTFVNESRDALLKPAAYFTTMPKEGGLGEPIIKALIYAAAFAVISFILGVILPISTFGAMGGVVGGSIGFFGIILYVIYAIICLFIGGAIVLVLSAICGGNTNYEANLRVAASLMVLLPVYALVGLLSWVSLWLGGIAGLAVFIYGFWMLYQALIKALGGKEGPAKVLTIILAVIPTLVILSGLVCAKVIYNKADELKLNTPSAIEEQIMKNIPESEREEAKEAIDQMKQINLDDVMKEAEKNMPKDGVEDK
ncbi:MAG TPA: Yip1 family protein [Spirochaetota bacterium]|nr:Yip1 family protein [Spirochaetota bacterium]